MKTYKKQILTIYKNKSIINMQTKKKINKNIRSNTYEHNYNDYTCMISNHDLLS